MKKRTFSLAAVLSPALALADVIVDPPKQEPDLLSQPGFQLLLVLGVLALGGLFYVRYQRARKRS
ncbi:MAG: hypothetical protein U0X91_32050 [Spirosomataceae bacterium]